MIFRCIVAVFLSLWAAGATAQLSDPPPVIDREGLLELIKARDFDRVEEVMTQTRDLVRRGEASTNDWRYKYRDFTTTNPQSARFVKDWLAEYPDSPFAHAAQAWILFTTGGAIRGDKFNRDTFPEALQIYSQMYSDAFDHALFAFEAEETLTPASDALIKLGLWLGRPNEAFDVVDHVMEIQPDWGTLNRAIDFASPSFGGNSDMADAICDHYGPKLSWPVENMVRYCKTVSNSRYFGNRWDEVREWIKDDPDPIWDYYRVQSLVGATPPNEEQAAYIVSFFKDSTSTDLRLAEKFDLYYSRLPGGEPVAHIVLERAKDHARETLKYDPYNLWALGILLRNSQTVTVEDDGSRVYKPTGSPAPAEELEYHRRRILASPYEPEYWSDYAMGLTTLAISSHHEAAALFTPDPLHINAIVYSNHDLDRVFGYIDHKMLQYLRLQAAEEQEWPDGWPELVAEVDKYQAIICPLIRAARLSEALVAAGGRARSYGNSEGIYLDEITDLRAQAKAEGQCEKEEASALDDLYFVPVEVDLTAPVWISGNL